MGMNAGAFCGRASERILQGLFGGCWFSVGHLSSARVLCMYYTMTQISVIAAVSFQRKINLAHCQVSLCVRNVQSVWKGEREMSNLYVVCTGMTRK